LATVVDKKNYDNGHAVIYVTITIPKLLKNHQIQVDINCVIDTGFDSGILLPDTVAPNREIIDKLPQTVLRLADESEITAFVCVGYIQKIDNHPFTNPGKPVTVIIYRQAGGLVGMDTLKHFSVTFDGFSQRFTITE